MNRKTTQYLEYDAEESNFVGVLLYVIITHAHLIEDVVVALQLQVECVTLSKLTWDALLQLIQREMHVELLRLISFLLIQDVVVLDLSVARLQCQPQQDILWVGFMSIQYLVLLEVDGFE